MTMLLSLSPPIPSRNALAHLLKLLAPALVAAVTGWCASTCPKVRIYRSTAK